MPRFVVTHPVSHQTYHVTMMAPLADELEAQGWKCTVETGTLDPMDTPLPCDVTVGGGTMRAGVPLRLLVKRMTMLHQVAFPAEPDPGLVAALQLLRQIRSGVSRTDVTIEYVNSFIRAAVHSDQYEAATRTLTELTRTREEKQAEFAKAAGWPTPAPAAAAEPPVLDQILTELKNLNRTLDQVTEGGRVMNVRTYG